MRIENIPDGLKGYMGDNIVTQLSGARKRVFLANRSGMRANYESTVDAALLDVQILFSDETQELLYSDVWERTDYAKGSRPELESIVSELTSKKDSEFGKVLELIRFCRDLYKKFRGRILFDGGTEEELIKKGEQLCECLSRLLVSLAEVAGIAGRIVTHCGGGHLTTELFVDKKWGYFDPRTGVFFLRPDGRVADVRELFDDPSIIDAQPEWVKAEVSERWSFDARAKKCKELFFNKNEVTTFKPYSLADSESYSYGWRNGADEFGSGLWKTSLEYARAQAELFGFEVEIPNPCLEFTLSDGQVIDKPVPVLALPTSAVAPERVRFRIDGETVYETPAFTPPEAIHNEIRNAYRLFGEGGVLDPGILSEGEHTLSAEVIGAAELNGKLSFVVKR